MYNAIIIDDDPFSHEIIKDLVASVSADFQIAAEYYSVREAVLKLPKVEVDLVFLDMELKDGKGFDVLEQLEEINFETIITTSHDSFMLQAIKHASVDYLLKPIKNKEFKEAIHRFEKRMDKIGQRKSRESGVMNGVSKLALPMQEGLILLNISEIVRLESDGAYTRFVLADGKEHVVSKNLGIFEEQLSAHSFFRVHHSHLVNLEQVRTYVKGDGGSVLMTDGSTVDVSRRKKEEFLKALGVD
jgi:two-component system LytT family response regulator